jgi:uncharacterized protein YjeT (DUF2065 family)
MAELVTAIGLVLVIEGLLYAVAPGRLKSLAELAGQIPDETLRMAGIVAIALGVGVVWIGRSVIGGWPQPHVIVTEQAMRGLRIASHDGHHPVPKRLKADGPARHQRETG